MRRWLIPLLIVVAFVGVERAVRYVQPPRTVPAGAWLAEPYPLRQFAARDLEGRDVSSASWSGKTVVVNFWATWCAPCRREMPALAALQQKYGDRLLVVGVLQDGVTADVARQFGQSLRVSYPIVPSTFEIEQSFPSVEVLPMTFLIDARQRVVAVYAGELDMAAFEADLGRVMGAP